MCVCVCVHKFYTRVGALNQIEFNLSHVQANENEWFKYNFL